MRGTEAKMHVSFAIDNTPVKHLGELHRERKSRVLNLFYHPPHMAFRSIVGIIGYDLSVKYRIDLQCRLEKAVEQGGTSSCTLPTSKDK